MQQTVTINIPDEFIFQIKDLDLNEFVSKATTNALKKALAQPKAKAADKLMEKIFEDAKMIKISKKINIDVLMNEMNDALS